MDDLSFQSIKLLIDFIFLSFDAFFKVVKVSFFEFQEFSELSGEELNLLQ